MAIKLFDILFSGLALLIFSSCNFVKKVEEKSRHINLYEAKALSFAKENRELKVHLSQLEYTIKNLEAENQFLKIKLEDKGRGGNWGGTKGQGPGHGHGHGSKEEKETNSPAVKDIRSAKGEDLVKFGIYRWKPDQLLAIAEVSFNQNEYEKSAQFFHSFIREFPTHKKMDDQVLFQAGLAAYKSENHYPWAVDYLNRLVQTYPTSKFFRGSKLWMALSHYKQGNEKEFFKTVEEFRLKYRNTTEWKILSAHYEELSQKYKH